MRSNSKAMIRTHIEEALAGELLTTDCAQHLVRLPTNLKQNSHSTSLLTFSTNKKTHFLTNSSNNLPFLYQMMMMIPEVSTWW